MSSRPILCRHFDIPGLDEFIHVVEYDANRDQRRDEIDDESRRAADGVSEQAACDTDDDDFDPRYQYPGDELWIRSVSCC